MRKPVPGRDILIRISTEQEMKLNKILNFGICQSKNELIRYFINKGIEEEYKKRNMIL